MPDDKQQDSRDWLSPTISFLVSLASLASLVSLVSLVSLMIDSAPPPPWDEVTYTFAHPSHSPLELSGRIETEWPDNMTLNESSSVRASLVYRTAANSTPELEDPSNVGRVAPLEEDVVPDGTAVPDAFGPGYDTRITASLVGSAFEIEPLNLKPYSLQGRDEVTWDWSVTPRQPGARELLLVVEAEWIPQDGGEPRVYQIARERLEVQVEQPLFIWGNSISIASLIVVGLSAIIGGIITFHLPKWLRFMSTSPGDKAREEEA